jgi:hypothetical protein
MRSITSAVASPAYGSNFLTLLRFGSGLELPNHSCIYSIPFPGNPSLHTKIVTMQCGGEGVRKALPGKH